MGNRREYTAEFKSEAIKLVKETVQSSAKIGRDLGIDGSMLSKWVRKYDGKMSAFPGKRDILKKALGYFASQKE